MVIDLKKYVFKKFNILCLLRLMVNFDCTCLWVESSIPFLQTFSVTPLFLKHQYSGMAIDYMHWQVALSRRFRALKLWFVIRSYGIDGLQKHIRRGVQMATLFESLVAQDDKFELMAERHMGLVVFRIKVKLFVVCNFIFYYR